MVMELQVSWKRYKMISINSHKQKCEKVENREGGEEKKKKKTTIFVESCYFLMENLF